MLSSTPIEASRRIIRLASQPITPPMIMNQMIPSIKILRKLMHADRRRFRTESDANQRLPATLYGQGVIVAG
jgi:hypothetical protein